MLLPAVVGQFSTAGNTKRLEKYGLSLHQEKSQLILSGHTAAMQANKAGKRLKTYKFLGFTCYWGKTRNGYWRLKFTSRRDRFTVKLREIREYLWNNLNTNNTTEVLTTVLQVMRGWINYHGISDNDRRVGGFIHKCKQHLFNWFNRRGRKRPMRCVVAQIRSDSFRFIKSDCQVEFN